MLPGRTVLRSFLLAVGIYVLLAVPWPGLRGAYRAAFRSVVSGVFAEFGSEGKVRVEYPTEKDRANPAFRPGLEDLVVALERRTVTWEDIKQPDGSTKRLPVTEGGALRVAIETGRVGYVPTALVIALVLATPMPWSRRLKSLVWAIVFVNLFVVVRVALLLTYSFAQDSPLQQFHLSALTGKVLAFTYEFLFVSPTGTVLVPALIWAIVSFTREDVANLTAVSDREHDKKG